MAIGIPQILRCLRSCLKLSCFILGSGLILLPLVGCHSETAAPPEHFVSPVQQDMHGLKGDDMPPAQGAPMPSGWKGFKAY